jgi:ArsR family transcriptional regulator
MGNMRVGKLENPFSLSQNGITTTQIIAIYPLSYFRHNRNNLSYGFRKLKNASAGKSKYHTLFYFVNLGQIRIGRNDGNKVMFTLSNGHNHVDIIICKYVHIFALRFMVFNQQKLEKAAFILKTIAHPTRLAIIKCLQKTDQLSVSGLVELTGCEQSLLSHHLSNMKLKGLLTSVKSGNNMLYSLKEKNLLQVLKCIDKCDCLMS